jgi:putative membrane protein insertion efficiency factor
MIKTIKKFSVFLYRTIKSTIIGLINLYQAIPTHVHNSCVFFPTCSEYTKQSIIKYGILKGIFLGIRRILRCHPWQKDHFDPIK